MQANNRRKLGEGLRWYYTNRLFSIRHFDLLKLANFIEDTISTSAKEARHTTTGNMALYLKHSEIQDYARRLRYGFITTLFSIIEDQLNEMCDAITRRAPGTRITYRNLQVLAKRHSIDRARVFLESLGFQIPKEEWRNIQKLRRLRNIIVHQDGEVDGELNLEYSETLVCQDPEGSQLFVSSKFCEVAVGEALAFFEKFQEINQKSVHSFLDFIIAKTVNKGGGNRRT